MANLHDLMAYGNEPCAYCNEPCDHFLSSIFNQVRDLRLSPYVNEILLQVRVRELPSAQLRSELHSQ